LGGGAGWIDLSRKCSSGYRAQLAATGGSKIKFAQK